eukprot:5985512-Prymnesium_polylepis.1
MSGDLARQQAWPQWLDQAGLLSGSIDRSAWTETVSLSCGSRSATHRPFRSDGAAVQFVHVPKAGGQSVTQMLQEVAFAHGMGVKIRNPWDGGPPPQRGRGSLLLGHQPVGWGWTPSSDAL